MKYTLAKRLKYKSSTGGGEEVIFGKMEKMWYHERYTGKKKKTNMADEKTEIKVPKLSEKVVEKR